MLYRDQENPSKEGYRTEIEEHAVADRVWYWGGYYRPRPDGWWDAYDGVHHHRVRSPAEAKERIKARWDYARA